MKNGTSPEFVEKVLGFKLDISEGTKGSGSSRKNCGLWSVPSFGSGDSEDEPKILKTSKTLLKI